MIHEYFIRFTFLKGVSCFWASVSLKVQLLIYRSVVLCLSAVAFVVPVWLKVEMEIRETRIPFKKKIFLKSLGRILPIKQNMQTKMLTVK